jgi:hypothetical protein
MLKPVDLSSAGYRGIARAMLHEMCVALRVSRGGAIDPGRSVYQSSRSY